jgi:hypothetical protein
MWMIKDASWASLTPGYETYRGLGWYGVLLQEAVKN